MLKFTNIKKVNRYKKKLYTLKLGETMKISILVTYTKIAHKFGTKLAYSTFSLAVTSTKTWLVFSSSLFDTPLNGIPAGHHIVRMQS